MGHPTSTPRDLPQATNEGSPALRVVVLASDPLAGECVAALLRRSASVSAECRSSVLELGRSLSQTRADAVLWFEDYVDAGSFGQLNAVRRDFGVPICLLAKQVDPAALRDAYVTQAEGLAVVMRDTQPDPAGLFRTLVQLVAGRVVLSPPALEGVLERPSSDSSDALSKLTPSEVAVLELIALGLRNGAIARRLARSEKLVGKHVGRIFSKLGLRDGMVMGIDRRVMAARAFLLARPEPCAEPETQRLPAG